MTGAHETPAPVAGDRNVAAPATGVLLLDADGRVLFANVAFQAMARVPAPDPLVPGPRLRDLVTPEEAHRADLLLEEALAYGHTAASVAFLDPEGERVHRVLVTVEHVREAAEDAPPRLLLLARPPGAEDSASFWEAGKAGLVADAILKTARAAAGARNATDLCRRAAEAFFDVYPSPIVAVHILDPRTDTLTLIAAEGEARKWLARGWRLAIAPASPSLLVQAVVQKRTLVKDRLDVVQGFDGLEEGSEGEVTPEEVRVAFARLGIRTLADTPILHEGRVYGVIGLGSRRETVDTAAVRLLELLAHEISVGLHRLELEASRERLLETTREAHGELAEFTYNVSHDLSEEFRRVATLIEALETDYASALPADAGDLLERITSHSRRLQAMIKGSLELAQLLKRVALTKETLPLEPFVEAAVERAAATSAGQGVRFHVAHPFPSVCADAAALPVLLDNLLDNAIKFNPAPHREVWVSATEEADAVELRVEDDGPGVPPEYRERIFQPFRKNPLHEALPGAGMGLTIVSKIAERHGGSVRVTDREGGPGASFRVRIPTAA